MTDVEHIHFVPLKDGVEFPHMWNINAWLLANSGDFKWHETPIIGVSFDNEEDAVMFKLKFGS